MLVAAEQDTVRAALHSLTVLQRQAVRLVFHDGLTHLQAAARLGIPVSTVKARVRNGICRLRVVVTAFESRPAG